MLIFQHLLFFLFVTKWLNIVRHIYDVLRTCSTALKDLQVSFTGYIESYLFIDSYAVKYNITTKHPQINRSMHFFKGLYWVQAANLRQLNSKLDLPYKLKKQADVEFNSMEIFFMVFFCVVSVSKNYIHLWSYNI